jgi:hypothetical protein
MVTRAQIERLRSRVEALARPKSALGPDIRAKFIARIEGIAARLRMAPDFHELSDDECTEFREWWAHRSATENRI